MGPLAQLADVRRLSLTRSVSYSVFIDPTTGMMWLESIDISLKLHAFHYFDIRSFKLS